MCKAIRVTVLTAAIGIAALSLTTRAHAGDGFAVGAGLVGFGIGAILGSALAPSEVYLIPPPPPDYYGPVNYGPPDYDGPVNYGPPDYDGPVIYGPPDYDGPLVNGPPPRTPNWYSNHAYPRSKTPPHAAADGQRPGPARSTTAKTPAAPGAVKQDAEVKFKTAQAKAKRDGVQTLTQKDIEGLSYEQIKQLRGY
jgi:hypothetical protein